MLCAEYFVEFEVFEAQFDIHVKLSPI